MFAKTLQTIFAIYLFIPQFSNIAEMIIDHKKFMDFIKKAIIASFRSNP